MAFQRHSGAAGPPLASLCCGGSPGTRRTVRRDRSSDLPGSAGRSLTATQQTAPSRSSRLVFQKPALVGLNPVVIPPKPLPSSGRWRRCSAPAGISSAACATGRPGRSEQFPATATAEMQCYRNRLLGGVVCRDGPFAHWSRLLAPPEHPVRSSAGPAAASAHRCSGRHPWRPGLSLRRS